MAKILNWNLVQKKLLQEGMPIFTPRELERVFHVSPSAAHFFVHRNTKKGYLLRLKKSQRGSLYAFSDRLPDPYWIANRIYEPSYLSFDTAMAFHHIIPETIYSVTSATTQATREFEVDNIHYQYLKIKKIAYTGYEPISYRGRIVLIAEPEKALADYIYFVGLGKRSLEYERTNLKGIRREKLSFYLRLFGREKLLEIMEEIYASTRKAPRTR